MKAHRDISLSIRVVFAIVMAFLRWVRTHLMGIGVAVLLVIALVFGVNSGIKYDTLGFTGICLLFLILFVVYGFTNGNRIIGVLFLLTSVWVAFASGAYLPLR